MKKVLVSSAIAVSLLFGSALLSFAQTGTPATSAPATGLTQTPSSTPSKKDNFGQEISAKKKALNAEMKAKKEELKDQKKALQDEIKMKRDALKAKRKELEMQFKAKKDELKAEVKMKKAAHKEKRMEAKKDVLKPGKGKKTE